MYEVSGDLHRPAEGTLEAPLRERALRAEGVATEVCAAAWTGPGGVWFEGIGRRHEAEQIALRARAPAADAAAPGL